MRSVTVTNRHTDSAVWSFDTEPHSTQLIMLDLCGPLWLELNIVFVSSPAYSARLWISRLQMQLQSADPVYYCVCFAFPIHTPISHFFYSLLQFEYVQYFFRLQHFFTLLLSCLALIRPYF